MRSTTTSHDAAGTAPVGTPTVAQALARHLADAGVRYAFGFPGGGSNLELIDALGEVGIDFIVNHTEVGAAFTAIATSEVTGAPSLVVVGNGPGLTSVVNGAAEAHLDRNPLVIVSDRYAESEAGTTDHQVLDQLAVLRPVVRWSATVRAEGAEATIRRALDVATTPPLGPVHLDMPRDVGAQTALPGEPDGAPVALAAAGAAAADPAALQAVARARRPLVAIGLEANGHADPDLLRRVVERLGAPFVTTYKAKGVVDERHPLAVGVLTGGTIEADAIAASDLVLAIGLDPVELLAKPYGYGVPVVSVRTNRLLDDYFDPVARHVGDIDAFLRAVLETVDGTATEWAPAAASGLRAAILDRLRIVADGGLAGWQVVEAVLAEAPPSAVVAADAGANMLPVTNFWRASGPRRFFISSGLASMGYAIPAAIGAAIARPDAVTFAFTGDGGAHYHLSELETAARAGARVVVVVLDDASLSMIRIKQEAKGLARRGMDFGSVDFARIGEAYGAHGATVSTERELRAAVRAAVGRERSTVIDVHIPGSEYRSMLSAIRG